MTTKGGNVNGPSCVVRFDDGAQARRTRRGCRGSWREQAHSGSLCDAFRLSRAIGKASCRPGLARGRCLGLGAQRTSRPARKTIKSATAGVSPGSDCRQTASIHCGAASMVRRASTVRAHQRALLDSAWLLGLRDRGRGSRRGIRRCGTVLEPGHCAAPLRKSTCDEPGS